MSRLQRDEDVKFYEEAMEKLKKDYLAMEEESARERDSRNIQILNQRYTLLKKRAAIVRTIGMHLKNMREETQGPEEELLNELAELQERSRHCKSSHAKKIRAS